MFSLSLYHVCITGRLAPLQTISHRCCPTTATATATTTTTTTNTPPTTITTTAATTTITTTATTTTTQAVAFDDMVLGVQSRAGHAQLDAQCGGAAQQLDTADASRAVLGALLQSGWGVAPSDAAWWSAARNATEPSLLWAVGRTPFGPYSERAELSFALRDAAARAALHARAAEVIAHAQQLANYYAEFGVSADAVLGEAVQLQVLQRVNVLAHKLERASAYLSLHSFDLARYYLHSTRHDLAAISQLLSAGAEGLGSRLVCGRQRGS